MAYIAYGDFRAGAGLAEYCKGLELTTTEATDAQLTAAIAGCSQRFDDETNDRFESYTATIDISVTYASPRLALPVRFTSLATVQTREADGTLTAQVASVWRFTSSLDSSGIRRIHTFDYIDIIPLSDGLASTETGSAYCWPLGPQTIRVNGTGGWVTTPRDVKRAVALLVYDHFKPLRNDLRRSDRWQTSDASFNTAESLPWGIPEADAVAENYLRESLPGVG